MVKPNMAASMIEWAYALAMAGVIGIGLWAQRARSLTRSNSDGDCHQPVKHLREFENPEVSERSHAEINLYRIRMRVFFAALLLVHVFFAVVVWTRY